MKKNFKIEMLRMKQAIELVINNNGEIPINLDNQRFSKTLTGKISLNENNVDSLIATLKKYFRTTKDIRNLESFTSKINKSSIVYKMNVIDEEQKLFYFENKVMMNIN